MEDIKPRQSDHNANLRNQFWLEFASESNNRNALPGDLSCRSCTSLKPPSSNSTSSRAEPIKVIRDASNASHIAYRFAAETEANSTDGGTLPWWKRQIGSGLLVYHDDASLAACSSSTLRPCADQETRLRRRDEVPLLSWSRLATCSITDQRQQTLSHDDCSPHMLLRHNEASFPWLDLIHRTASTTADNIDHMSHVALRFTLPDLLPFQQKLIAGIGLSGGSWDGLLFGMRSLHSWATPVWRLIAGHVTSLTFSPAENMTRADVFVSAHASGERFLSNRFQLLARARGRLFLSHCLEHGEASESESGASSRLSSTLLFRLVDGSAEAGKGMNGLEVLQHAVRGVSLRSSSVARLGDQGGLAGGCAWSLELERLKWKYEWCRPLVFANGVSFVGLDPRLHENQPEAASKQTVPLAQQYRRHVVTVGFGVVRTSPQTTTNMFNAMIPQRVECTFNWLRQGRRAGDMQSRWLHRDEAHPDQNPIPLTGHSGFFFPFKCGTTWDF